MKESSGVTRETTHFPDTFKLGYVSRWKSIFWDIVGSFKETNKDFKDWSGLSFWLEWMMLVYQVGEEEAVRVLRSRLVMRSKADSSPLSK